MKNKTTIWITGDQCSLWNSALSASDRNSSTVLMIESVERGSKLKYHKKKLVLIYSTMRHFANDLSKDGWQVDYYQEHADFKSALSSHLAKFQPSQIRMMEQSEFGTAESFRRMVDPIPLDIYPHSNFLSTASEFESLHKNSNSRVTMESFYRLMRKKTGILMDGENPVGGRWNYDQENRKPPSPNLSVIKLKHFPPDEITLSVIDMVDRMFPDHPGNTKSFFYAVTRENALLAATDFFEHRLNQFGTYQDAMVYGEPFLNHSVLSPYINVGLLHPLELMQEAAKRLERGQATLNSVEGFVRQLLGWREFIWRVYWRLMPDYKNRNGLNASQPLPEFFRTGQTNMRCLSDALQSVLDHGYAHHIARLMLLGNFALIAGLNPLETNDWFASMFVDGYDWVMVPNVIGMTLHADGGYVGTKPYAASANYINKMSNYCRNCIYDYKESTTENACPFNFLYWHFLIRNQDAFKNNQRMALILGSLSKKDDQWKKLISKRAVSFLKGLNSPLSL